jgi:hypothetical protein
MNENQFLFIEQAIIITIKHILSERVNELLHDMPFAIPLVDFSSHGGSTVICPVISLASCERSEKERIICLDAYSLTMSFYVPETPESELHCYAYAAAVDKALTENTTLGGVADRVSLSGKKYIPPKKHDCGQRWELIITLRISVEGNTYDS